MLLTVILVNRTKWRSPANPFAHIQEGFDDHNFVSEKLNSLLAYFFFNQNTTVNPDIKIQFEKWQSLCWHFSLRFASKQTVIFHDINPSHCHILPSCGLRQIYKSPLQVFYFLLPHLSDLLELVLLNNMFFPSAHVEPGIIEMLCCAAWWGRLSQRAHTPHQGRDMKGKWWAEQRREGKEKTLTGKPSCWKGQKWTS